MGTPSQSDTRFLPAGRATSEELECQMLCLSDVKSLKEIMDSLIEIVLILNPQRQIVFANKAFVQHFGFKTTDDVLGLRPGEALKCEHAFLCKTGCGTTDFCRQCGAAQALSQALRGTTGMHECRITHRIEEMLTAMDLQVKVTPFVVGDQEFMIFTCKDISHEKRRRIMERLFFHDIFNTAGALRGYTDLLNMAVASPEKLKQYANQINELSHIIIDQLSSQKELMDAENKDLQVNPVKLRSLEVIQNLIGGYMRSDAAVGRHLHIDPDTTDMVFTSDATLLSRVLGNMIKNGLEAVGKGGIVTIGCNSRPGGLEFWVHNPGGIPHDVQLQIFKRSFSTKGGSRGLGTYSIKLFTEQYLKGEAAFTSSESAGTRFYVRLPEGLGEK